MKRISTIHLILILVANFLLAQQNPDSEKLRKRLKENFELLKTNPEIALPEAEKIEEKARELNISEIELEAIINQITHYKRNNDFKNMLAMANSLYQKAELYNMSVYQVIAKRYLFEAYAFSGLPDKAFQELEAGNKLIKNLNENDSLSTKSRADIFTSYSNYYLLKEDFKNSIKYIKLSGKEYEKLPEGKYKQKTLSTHYSNLSGAYYNVNQIDSAKFFAKLSFEKEKKYNRNDIQSANLFLLGKIALSEKNYQTALHNFKQAESLKGYKNHLNTMALYDNIALTYNELNKKDSAKLYDIKKDSLQLIISQNQNQSLHSLLNDKKEEKSNVYLYILAVILAIMAIFTFLVSRKNRILAKQEKISREYLETSAKNPRGEEYSKLMQALKENNPAFMFYFEDMFSDFSSKLLKINPEISTSEIEFCALLKLNISTKDIARYKFIAPKTVQNKKHIIRKKVKIPKEIDIYHWFEEF